MRCPNCGSKMTFGAIAEHDLGGTLGLISVVVRNLPAFVCASCEDVLVPGPVLEQMSSMVVRELLTHSFPLGGVEVRFLRKAAGLTQLELASRLGVDRVTIARWESGEKEHIGGPESIAVRAVIGAVEGSPVRAQPVETLRHAPEAHPRSIVLDAPSSPPPSM